MKTLTIIKSFVVLAAVSLLAISPSMAQTAPGNGSAPTENHRGTLAERIARLEKHQQRIENRLNSGKLNSEQQAKAQERLTKIQNRLAKLQAKEAKTT